MNLSQIRLVKQTFEAIRPPSRTSELVVTRFYRRLFELDPELRPLFKGDIKAQGEKLMEMLAYLIDGLDNPATTLSTLRALGQRHATYGVQAKDYATMEAALLWTVQQSLGASYTPQVEAAWRAAYELIASVMQQAGAMEESHKD